VKNPVLGRREEGGWEDAEQVGGLEDRKEDRLLESKIFQVLNVDGQKGGGGKKGVG